MSTAGNPSAGLAPIDPALVEKAARAIYEANGAFHSELAAARGRDHVATERDAWGEANDYFKDLYAARARAALSAVLPDALAEKQAEIERLREEVIRPLREMEKAARLQRNRAVELLDVVTAERDAARAEVAAARAVVAEEIAAPETAVAVARLMWDRFEADYWNHEVDRRPFDPTVTELDHDDCDRGAALVAEVSETLADLLTVLATVPAAEAVES